MSDYRARAERLLNWTVLDIQQEPCLTYGMMRSAGAAIEKLADEVDRLNRENFWLSKHQMSSDKKMVELPPLDIGDDAWCVGRFGGNYCIKRGKVFRFEIRHGRVAIYVKGLGVGEYGERVFSSREDAEAHLAKGVTSEND